MTGRAPRFPPPASSALGRRQRAPCHLRHPQARRQGPALRARTEGRAPEGGDRGLGGDTRLGLQAAEREGALRGRAGGRGAEEVPSWPPPPEPRRGAARAAQVAMSSRRGRDDERAGAARRAREPVEEEELQRRREQRRRRHDAQQLQQLKHLESL